MEKSKKINKESWGDGPWNTEKDHEQWVDPVTNYHCIINRTHSTGALCGYVGIPKGHFLYGREYNDKIKKPDNFDEITTEGLPIISIFANKECVDSKEMPVDWLLKAHGGITWSGPHFLSSEEDLWYFGFDCSHSGDICPAYDHDWAVESNYEYRDFEYVKNWVKRLAHQLKELEITHI